MEFVEGGEVCGVELVEPISGTKLALRDRSKCVGRPTLAGFDIVAVELASAQAVHDMADWCASSGAPVIGILGFPGGAAMDIPDPDGTVIRIHHAAGRPPFIGHDSTVSGDVVSYSSPRLTGIPLAR